MIKKLFLFLAISVLCCNVAFSQAQQENSSKNATIYVNYKDCIQTFPVDAQRLFLLALSAVSEQNYKFVEVQSTGGYILFDAFSREFLIQIAQKEPNLSQIKITPANNSYVFNVDLINRIFKSIASNFEN